MKTLFLVAASLLTAPAFAQSAPASADEFMVVVGLESPVTNAAKIIFAPAFQGKTEVALESMPGPLSNKFWPTYQHNLEVVTQQLGAVSAAGWELVGVTSLTAGQQYLFRRARK